MAWIVDPAWFLSLLGAWAVGIGVLINARRKATLARLFLHMAGTFMPHFRCPQLVWADAPFVLTRVGQCIVKSIIFVGTAPMVFAHAEDS